MAIDPKLVSIKKAADLPSGIPTASGEFLYFEDETLMKAEMSDLYDRLESAYLGIITPSSTIPTTGSWYGTVLADGTFNNVSPAITVDVADFDVENGTPNNEVRIIITEGVASKDVRRVKGDKGDPADPAKLPLYSAIKGSNIIAGTQFIDDENGNIQYRVKAGQTLLTTDIPANVVGTKVEQIGGSDPKITTALTTFLKTPTTAPISNLASIRVAGWLLNDNTIQTGTSNYTVKDLDVLTVDYFDFTGVRAKRSDIGATFLLGTLPDNSIEVIAPANAKTTTPNVTETLRFNIKKYSKISFSYSTTAVPVINLVTGDVSTADAVKKEIDAKVSNADAVMLNGSETTGLSTNQIFKVLGDFKNTEIEANLATTLVNGWIQSANNLIQAGAVLQSQKDIPVTGGQTYIYHSSLAYSTVYNPPVSVLGVTADGLFLPLLKNGAGVSPNTERMYEVVIPSNVVAVSVTFNTAATVKNFGLKKTTLPQTVKNYIDAKTVNVPSLQDRLDKLDTFISIVQSGGVYRLDQKVANNFKSTVDGTDKIALDIIPLNNLQNQIVTFYLKANATPAATDYPPNVKWKDNVVPTIIADKEYFIMFQSFNFGQTWLGSFIGEWTSKKTIAFDNFIRENNTTTMGSTVEGALTWNSYGNAWGIKNNMPYQEVPNFPSLAYVEIVNPYVIITAVFNSNTNANAIAFKIKDATNYNVFQLNAVTNLVTRKRFLDGAATATANYPITPASEYVLQVKLEESGMMTFYCNGIELGSLLEEVNKTELKAGLCRESTFEMTCTYFSILEV